MSYHYWNKEIQKINRVTYTVSQAFSIEGFDKEKITDTMRNLNHLNDLAQTIFNDLGPSLDDEQYTSGEELNHSEEYHQLKKVVQGQLDAISDVAAVLENKEYEKHHYCPNDNITFLRYVYNDFFWKRNFVN